MVVTAVSQLQVKALSEENERLRRDNERFVRLIDSGEWGRGRVSELVSAGEVRGPGELLHLTHIPAVANTTCSCHAVPPVPWQASSLHSWEGCMVHSCAIHQTFCLT